LISLIYPIVAFQARVKEFQKTQRILQPAESTLNRLISEQRHGRRR